jgi:hypothetical protein
MLMLGGVALIGSLAASLGSFFNSGGTLAGDGSPEEAVDAEPDEHGELLAEIRALRAEMAEIRRHLGDSPPAGS